MNLPLDLKHVRRRTADHMLDGALTGIAWIVATLLLLGYAWEWFP